MTKDVTLADLRDHLEEHIEEVRRGTTLRLMDGKTEIALLSPSERVTRRTPEELIYRVASKEWKDFVPPPPLETDIDVVALLREDRDTR
jgi:antitoxin (DNA-binding transcriptional repressor) of toxin-antitoxin stability system